MRCLITADLHYSLKQFDWLMRAAPDFDLVVLAGDHLDMFSNVDGRAQILVVSKYLERLALTTQLLVSSGNHDLDGQVLNCCVTATNDTPSVSRTSTIFAKSASDRVRRSTL